ncbi:54S ribosomal protein L22, mitochondrial [Agyrium rufum]|nr:54S ribosomal protein L22, mitochondrial [Agyrium rufum]
MRSSVPPRRLVHAANNLALIQQRPSIICPHQTQSRTVFSWFRRNEKKQTALDSVTRDPSSPDFLRKRPTRPSQQRPEPGTLARGSILDDGTTTETGQAPAAVVPRNAHTMQPAINPKPVARARWHRKQVIRSVRHRGRINKETLIARTERDSLSKSPFWKTSVKKLMPLARQISGKTLEEAMIQMRFSKKKVAKDVLEHLKLAVDEATVKKGMGLGLTTLKGKGSRDTSEGPWTIYDRKGKRRVVQDQSQVYIDQAWVGRGTYGRLPDYRARGRVFIMRPPHTSLTVVLKEEATRVRLTQEKAEKRAKRPVWTALPDRPIPGQRQHVLW